MAKYENFIANLEVLKSAPEQDLSNEFITSGIIDKFAMQFELSWKLLKKALEYEGVIETSIGSPRQVIKASYSVYDFIDEALWLDMLDDRNSAERIYDSEMAARVVEKILATYIPAFAELQDDLQSFYGEELLLSF